MILFVALVTFFCIVGAVVFAILMEESDMTPRECYEHVVRKLQRGGRA
jgi:hypothetical protein